MSQLRALLLIGSAAFALAACGADDVASPGEGVIVQPVNPTPPPVNPDPDPDPNEPGEVPTTCPTGTTNAGIFEGLRNCQLSGRITGNLNLPNVEGVIYSLSGGVRVGSDVGGDGNKAGGAQGILSIDPGVLIFGESGADFLLIERGSQIRAVGEAQKPIVFTSAANVRGESTASSIGQWGGLVILGRAPIHTCIGVGVQGGTAGCESQVEGADGFYGGATANDNSGRLEYVQVRYSGFEVTTGNELNGITLAGVGSGTTIRNVQVHNSSDDGIEWFGGTVNGKYLVLTGIDDDSLDTDLGYRGVNQFVLVQQRTEGGDFVIEAESDGNDLLTPRSRPVFANFTFLGNRTGAVVMMRGGTDYGLYNGVINSTTASACVQLRGQQTIAAANPAIEEEGPPVFASVFMSCTKASGIGHSSSSVTDQQVINILTGNNNVLGGTSTLTNTYFPGANENAVPAFATLSAVNPFLVNTDYVGAFRDAADTWFAGWTCGLPGQTSCTAAARPIR
ncbi:MAG: hypothetical protein WCZ66_03665 [Sphingomonadaceae bacterium]